MLDVSSLNSAEVGDGRARFAAGVKGMQAHQALAAAAAGLPLGRCPTIGLAGVTLGGGLSAFTRAWGLACGRLREIEIVTADGRVRHVRADSPSPDDDLFWALCGGGGGNYGVVTALECATKDIRRRGTVDRVRQHDYFLLDRGRHVALPSVDSRSCCSGRSRAQVVGCFCCWSHVPMSSPSMSTPGRLWGRLPSASTRSASTR